MTERSNTLEVTTAEGITFNLYLAGPVSRCLAWALDVILILVLEISLGSLLGTLSLLSLDAAQAFTILSYFIISIGYGIFLEWRWQGQTVGKRLLRLRVMDEKGMKLHFSQILTRNLFRAVDVLPFCYLLGGLCSLVSHRGQRLGDLAAGTIVIRIPLQHRPDLEQLMGGKYNTFRSCPGLETQLRRRLTPDEATLALRAVLRRESFDAASRIQVFAEIAAYLRSRLNYPPEAVEDLSDEQLVRNSVDSLYRLQQ